MLRSMNLFCVVVSLIWILYMKGGINANYEGDVLIAIKKALINPENYFQSWDPSLVNPCTWAHITCNSNSEVISLDLRKLNLSGRLAPDIGKLTKLQDLELFGNSISGPIPDEIGNLVNLVSLELQNNRFNGPIPKTIGKLSKLKYLRLGDNDLSGCVPVISWRNIIPNLVVVDISYNPKLCGPYTQPSCNEC